MMLTARPQVAEPGEFRLWVAAFDTEQPPALSFTLDGHAASPLAAPGWLAIRDRQTGPGRKPLNHQMVVRLPGAIPGELRRIGVHGGGQRVDCAIRAAPAAVPLKKDGSFNILLASCYFQPEDRNGLLGQIVARLPLSQRPHLTLLGGDQVYGDLPLFEDLPETEPHLSHWLGDKYRRNWMSDGLGIAGLQSVLGAAPTLCLADDHEFWNNFPFVQAQLPNTWTEAGRKRWGDAARALYEDYQQGGAPGAAPSFWRLDIQPLKLLVLDTRCGRGEKFDDAFGLMPKPAQDALDAWVADLIAAHAQGDIAVGVLSTGQALFVPTPGDVASKVADAELVNYVQAALIQDALLQLAAAGVPVVFLTGDVHWGRITTATYRPRNAPLLYEVICSPSRLIHSPGHDQKARLANALRGIFGKREIWPRHSEAQPPPDHYGPHGEFTLKQNFGLRGDQVAIVRFNRAGSGLEMTVTYFPIHDDAAVREPRTWGPVSLLPV